MLNLLVEETSPAQVNDAGGAYTAETAALVGGGYVVAWLHVEDTGSGQEYSVRAQRFNSDGAEVGSEIVVASSTLYTPQTVAVAGLSDGSFVVSWELPNEGALNQSADIQARIYAEDGSPIGVQFIANTSTGEEEVSPEAIALIGGGFVLVWHVRDQQLLLHPVLRPRGDPHWRKRDGRSEIARCHRLQLWRSLGGGAGERRHRSELAN